MQWLLLGAVVVALLFMSSRFPKVAFTILGALGLAAAIIIFTTKDDALLSRRQLPLDNVRIENAVITRAYGGSFQFNARLANTDDSILLKESVLSITLLDCPVADGDAVGDEDCTVIGQKDLHINIKIPAGQSRDISKNMFFDDAIPAGAPRWRYKVIETRS